MIFGVQLSIDWKSIGPKVRFLAPPIVATIIFAAAWVSKDDEVREAQRLRAEQIEAAIQLCKDTWLHLEDATPDEHQKIEAILSDCYRNGRAYFVDPNGNWQRVR